MFKFINKKGETFAGTSPYIHWIDGQLSTGLWHVLKLMIISDKQTLNTSTLSSDSIFKFIDSQQLSNPDLELDNITVNQLTSTGQLAYIPNNNIALEQDPNTGDINIPIRTIKITANTTNPVTSNVNLSLTGDVTDNITIPIGKTTGYIDVSPESAVSTSALTISPEYDDTYYYKLNYDEEPVNYSPHNLPDAYKELKYITTDTRAAFKVSYTPRSTPYPGFKINMHCEPSTHTSNQRVFGVWRNQGYNEYGLYVLPHSSNNELRFIYINSSNTRTEISLNYNYSGDFMQECSLINQSGVDFAGSNISMPNNSSRYDYAEYIGIGTLWDCTNNRLSVIENASTVYINYLALYKGTTKSYEFIPCKRISDGKVGMYDLVNNVFHASETGTEFGAGPGCDITVNNITMTALTSDPFYIHQLFLVCSSNIAGEYIDEFELDGSPISVGADLYDIDETLSINLGNRGLELPESIQKAFLDVDINEDKIDNTLINRKFKELISNYIDIVDNKGSYKSLYNSLKWFEWGDNVRLYEIWKNNSEYLEKNLSNILSETYSSLLYSYSKTTHLALVTALQQITDQIDDELNPVLENIQYDWSTDELALKVSILGAFFERYFMPIHLDLKRACVEAMIYSNQVKTLCGTINDKSHFFDDYAPIDVKMDKTVTLGNIDAVAVGPNTMFGRYIENTNPVSPVYYIEPVGVDLLDNIGSITNSSGDYDSGSGDRIHEDLARFYLQLAGGVGTVVPITITVDLPDDDSLSTEVITIVRDGNPNTILQVTEHKMISPVEGKASFTFNLLSTKEETVEFSLMLTSMSGHTWNTKTGYQCIDPRGSYLNVYHVTGKSFGSMDEWLKNPVPNEAQFDPYVNPNNHSEKNVIQYIPYTEDDNSLFNQVILIKNNKVNNEYDITWVDASITNDFWVIYRSGEYNANGGVNTDDPGTDEHPKYVILISKKYGKKFVSKTAFLTAYNLSNGFTTSNVLRMNMTFIAQLHEYTNIESKPITLENYTYTSSNLLCVIPQFTRTVAQSIDVNSIFWEYTNKTTLETIRTRLPIQTPLISHNSSPNLLTPGYWTVTMYYKLDGSSEWNKLTKNSAFKIQAQ